MTEREETTLYEVVERIRDGTFYDDYDWASGPALRALDAALDAAAPVPASLPVVEEGELAAAIERLAGLVTDYAGRIDRAHVRLARSGMEPDVDCIEVAGVRFLDLQLLLSALSKPRLSREEIARAIIGPRNPVPLGSNHTVEELREIRWQRSTSAEHADALWAADAVLALIEAHA